MEHCCNDCNVRKSRDVSSILNKTNSKFTLCLSSDPWKAGDSSEQSSKLRGCLRSQRLGGPRVGLGQC